MMDTPTIFSITAIVIALASLAGLTMIALIIDTDNPQIQANQDNIGFLYDADKVMRNIMGSTINRSANNTDKIKSLQDYDETITTQIGNIRSDIKSKFPQASNVVTTEQTSISTTPFLTLTMEQREFVLGNVVFFTGTAQPSSSIQLTLKDPDRVLTALIIPRGDIIGGSYIANFTLRLDDPIGTWQVYARQLSDQTKTLTFLVE